MLLRNTPYRRLYSARLVSLMGDWFNLLALVALLREIGGNGAMALGGTLILKSLPPLLATPIAGWVADRFPRKTIMIASDVGRAVVVLGMMGQLIHPSLPILMALVALQAFLGAFFEPARRAMTPSVVAPQDLETAGVLDAATWSAMLALGAALGGLTTALLGWEAALLVDAATYVVSVLFLLGVPRIQVVQQKGSGTLREGAAYLRANPRVWTLVLVKMGWSVAGATTLILTLLGEGPLHAEKDPLFARLAAGAQDASVIGVTVLYVSRGLGTAVGPFVARWLSRGQAKRMEWLIGISFAWGAFFYAGVGSNAHLVLGGAFRGGGALRRSDGLGLFHGALAAAGSRRTDGPGLCRRAWSLYRHVCGLDCGLQRPFRRRMGAPATDHRDGLRIALARQSLGGSTSMGGPGVPSYWTPGLKDPQADPRRRSAPPEVTTMHHQQSLGRLVAWTQSEKKGFLHMRYLLPEGFSLQLFLSIPGSQIEEDGELVNSSISFAGQRIWMEAEFGERELDVRFEKLNARTPVELVTWFEDGLEEYTGCLALRRPVLSIAA